MKMIRELMLGSVAAVGLLLPLASAPQAQAHSGHGQVAHRWYYHIYYRACPCDAWHYLGWYPCECSARQAGAALSARGYYWYCQPLCH